MSGWTVLLRDGGRALYFGYPRGLMLLLR